MEYPLPSIAVLWFMNVPQSKAQVEINYFQFSIKIYHWKKLRELNGKANEKVIHIQIKNRRKKELFNVKNTTNVKNAFNLIN